MVEIRIQKRKPRLGKILDYFKEMGDSSKEAKEIMIQKLRLLYSGEPITAAIREEDEKFDLL